MSATEIQYWTGRKPSIEALQSSAQRIANKRGVSVESISKPRDSGTVKGCHGGDETRWKVTIQFSDIENAIPLYPEVEK